MPHYKLSLCKRKSYDLKPTDLQGDLEFENCKESNKKLNDSGLKFLKSGDILIKREKFKQTQKYI